jgi:hypothetical protein
MTENMDVDLIVLKQITEPNHIRNATVNKQLVELKLHLNTLVYIPTSDKEDTNNSYSFLQNALINSRVLYR